MSEQDYLPMAYLNGLAAFAHDYFTGLEASSSKPAAVQELEENSRTIPAVQKKESSRVKGSRVLRVNIRLEGIDHTVLDSYVEYLRRMALGMQSHASQRCMLGIRAG
jgi:hypothetical protein